MNPLFSVHNAKYDWLGKDLEIETGYLARQASGSVWVSYGKARILCTVVVSHKKSEESFLPLSVHYLEKFSAAGRIPGGFLKRESKPSDQEILISRIIDRSIRPLFHQDFCQEVQVMCTVYSHDDHVDNAFLSIIGTSAALGLSNTSFAGPIAAIRTTYQDGSWAILEQHRRKEASLDLFASGTQKGIVMVECQAQEHDRALIVDGLEWAHRHIVPLNDFICSFVARAGGAFSSDKQDQKTAVESINSVSEKDWDDVCAMTDRHQRKKRLEMLLEQSQAELSVFNNIWRAKARKSILKTKKRLDGRTCQEVRPIFCQTRFLPGCHGSAVFTRGNTQTMVSVTLGCKTEGQTIESLSETRKDTFLLHYNFPAFSVGEAGRVAPPGRRELGHGYLARKGIAPVVPDLPCTIRIVSDVTESYGSSSMATVCGGCLALFDAGIHLKRPVAGVAMGLIQEEGQSMTLSDISGTEDWLGDMDFKVIGTEKGITAIQMDLKGEALSRSFFQEALDQAHGSLIHILNEMKAQSPMHPSKDNDNAPSFGDLSIPKNKIGSLIGQGGKNIRNLCENTHSKIDIGDDGKVSIMALNQASLDQTLEKINNLIWGPEIGKIYTGTVVALKEFGAFVNFGFDKDGLVHISEIREEKVDNIADVLSEGQVIDVKVIEIDSAGRIKLTHKGVKK